MSKRLTQLLFAVALCAVCWSVAGTALAAPSVVDVVAPSPSDMVYDDARGILYIGRPFGEIVRYDYLGGKYLPSLHIDGNPRGMDLSPDGSTLAIADSTVTLSALNRFHLLNTTTGADTKVFFNLSQLGEAGTYSVAFTDDAKVFVASSTSGSGWAPLRLYDLVTKQTQDMGLVPGSTMLAPSADHRYVSWVEAKVAPGGWAVWDSEVDGVVMEGSVGAYPYEVSCNGEGSLVAVPTYNGTFVQGDGPPDGITIPGAAIGSVFHPNNDIVFVSPADTNQVVAYSVESGAPLATYPCPDAFIWWGHFEAFVSGRLKTGAGGGLLFVMQFGGIRVIQTGLGPVPLRFTWDSPSSGHATALDGEPAGNVGLLVTLRGGPAYDQLYAETTTTADGAFSFAAPVLRDARHAHLWADGSDARFLEADADGPTLPFDAKPPVTSASAPSGWYSQDGVEVVLDASDPAAPGGASSGVAGTFVSVDGGPSRPYSDPVHITALGRHTVAYRSVDAVGNLEATRVAECVVDRTPPTATLTGTNASRRYVNAAVITCVGSDADSGIGVVSYSVDGGAEKTGARAVLTTPGDHDISFTCADRAGNVTSVRCDVSITTRTPKLTGVSAPSRVHHGSTARIGAAVAPADVKGGTPTRFFVYQYVRGAWKLRAKKVGAASLSSARTDYAASVTLPTAGRWRVRAEYTRGGHVARSGWKNITVD